MSRLDKWTKLTTKNRNLAIIHYDSKHALNGWKWLDEKEIVAYGGDNYQVGGDVVYLLKNGKFTNVFHDNHEVPFFDNSRFYKDKNGRVYLVYSEYLPRGETQPPRHVVKWVKEHGLTIKIEKEGWIMAGSTTFIIYYGE